jgi:uncharacterized cupin superfamily protein
VYGNAAPAGGGARSYRPEFCRFLEGRATFTPDVGEPIEITAGDVVHFPERSLGVWDILEASRKIFMVFDEEPSA